MFASPSNDPNEEFLDLTSSFLVQRVELNAFPKAISLVLAETALLVIDPQRDFMERGGFGEFLGNDPELLRSIIRPLSAVLSRARELGMRIIYTREGHHPDLRDCPSNKLDRWPEGTRIGDMGPMGRILIRGEPGHAIIPELAPLPHELVIDKPGKDAFYNTILEEVLVLNRVRRLLVTGVTTDVCVETTIRTGNDRGVDLILVDDCCASYSRERHKATIETITAQGGIFGFSTKSNWLLEALSNLE